MSTQHGKVLLLDIGLLLAEQSLLCMFSPAQGGLPLVVTGKDVQTACIHIS